jgi:hypothetical protein
VKTNPINFPAMYQKLADILFKSPDLVFSEAVLTFLKAFANRFGVGPTKTNLMYLSF